MSDLEGKSAARIEMHLEVIRGDGRREPIGIVGSTSWHRWSPRHWPASVRIRWINYRNRRYLKERT